MKDLAWAIGSCLLVIAGVTLAVIALHWAFTVPPHGGC